LHVRLDEYPNAKRRSLDRGEIVRYRRNIADVGNQFDIAVWPNSRGTAKGGLNRLVQSLVAAEREADIQGSDADGSSGPVSDQVFGSGPRTIVTFPSIRTNDMPPASSLRTMAPLTDAEFDELDRFLLSESTSDETMTMTCLDGYLTAIVVGPTAVMPSVWLPHVWGSTEKNAPEFDSIERAQHILSLMMRHMNGIVWALQHNPNDFDPLFDSFRRESESLDYIDGEAWAHGFMQGVALSREAWQPLFDDSIVGQAIRPIHLLGSDDVTDVEESLTRTPEQREKISEAIPASVAAIYRFWLSRRQNPVRALAGSPQIRRTPKPGRNDPCPCGSGRKFKKCCGVTPTLH
jgi:uncharacterized protein